MSYKPPFTITSDILNLVAETLAQNAPVNAPQNAPVNAAGLKTPDAILALIQHSPAITRQQMADAMGKDIRTIGRALTKLQQAGKIKRIGSDKTGHWVMLARKPG